MKSFKFMVLSWTLALLALPVWAQDGSFFDEPQQDTGTTAAPLMLNGKVFLETQATPDFDDPLTSNMQVVPGLELDLEYHGTHSDAKAKLHYLQKESYANLEDLIDEAYLRLYWGDIDLELGYLKLVWGKGDKLHVIDILNPMNYAEFIVPDYLERKQAEKMAKLNIGLGTETLLELVYLPVFTPDNIPQEGKWAPYQTKQMADALQAALTSWVTNRVAYLVSTPYSGLPPAAATELATLQATQEAAALQADAIQTEDTATLEHGQAGLRLTSSLGMFDLGISYVYGFTREPSLDLSKLSTQQKIYISYDRVHMLGLEGSAAVGPFTLRSELGAFMTYDATGEDPLVHNWQLSYLYGADWDLPVSNLMLAVQGIGSYILGTDNIKSNGVSDIQYREDGKYTQNMLIFSLRDSYNYETIRPEIAFVLGVEHGDWMLKPSLKLELTDDALLTLTYFMFQGDADTNFGQFDENDLLQLLVEYSF